MHLQNSASIQTRTSPPQFGLLTPLLPAPDPHPLDRINSHRHPEVVVGDVARQRVPWLKGSVGEGPNQTNYSDRSSVRILGIERKPRKTTPSKWHATQNTRRGRRKGKQTALRQRGGLRTRTNSNDAILAIKRCNACLHKRICLPSKYDKSALRSVERRL